MCGQLARGNRFSPFLACWIAATWLVLGLPCSGGEASASDQRGLLFPETHFDFGKSVQGELIEHDFVVTNEGTTPLRIAKVTLTPPLLATRIPGEIAPGATAAVHTQLDTSQLQGSFSGEIVVYIRGDDSPLTTLAFEGVVVTPIEVSPMPAFFVVGQRGQGAERAIDLINHEAQPLHIECVDHGAPAFSTRLDTVQPGQRYRLNVNLRPDGPAGKRTDVITLRTSSANTPTLRIPVHTNLRERVYAFPDAVDLGALKLSIIRGQPDLLAAITQTLMVYQTAGNDFVISVDSDLPSLVLSYERGPRKDRYEISAGLNGSQTAVGRLQGSIRIHTNDPEVPVVVVPVTGLILDG